LAIDVDPTTRFAATGGVRGDFDQPIALIGVCDATVFGPPLTTHCATLDGPATVRISNH
jgi:hypothetical protein